MTGLGTNSPFPTFLRMENAHAGTKGMDMTKQDKNTPAAKATDKDGKPAGDNVTGLGYNGEFRIGKITLATGADGSLRLRHSNDGSETEVAEIVVESVLEEAFFTRKIDADGNDRKGTATK